MELNKNSISARLYRWYYNNQLPTNLCPYFWKLVIMYILIVPFVVISLPILLIDRFKIANSEKVDIIFSSCFFYFGLYLVGCILMVPLYLLYFIPINGFTQNSFMLGVTMFLLLCGIGLTELCKLIYHGEEPVFKEKKPNILVEMAKAKYHKYCPQIKWK
jgi:hypothetical protein